MRHLRCRGSQCPAEERSPLAFDAVSLRPALFIVTAEVDGAVMLLAVFLAAAFFAAQRSRCASAMRRRPSSDMFGFFRGGGPGPRVPGDRPGPRYGVAGILRPERCKGGFNGRFLLLKVIDDLLNVGQRQSFTELWLCPAWYLSTVVPAPMDRSRPQSSEERRVPGTPPFPAVLVLCIAAHCGRRSCSIRRGRRRRTGLISRGAGILD